jgi:hypothetical protein
MWASLCKVLAQNLEQKLANTRIVEEFLQAVSQWPLLTSCFLLEKLPSLMRDLEQGLHICACLGCVGDEPSEVQFAFLVEPYAIAELTHPILINGGEEV